ncbi:radical SAM protein [Desulfopila sp. IMCC35008]|uniref:B12-binding domain-containing radical SAM protein n=1 Tax=Desulfopila sp. IMCC35008 TaxID=2653858 RepID=UPI0013D0EC0D|nr:B12-binding domain-containing radical SAM protein [Desulfopila sp. IMCC35008]
MLLIHPPQTKPAEPPAGIPLLAGALRNSGQQCVICDLNIEGLHYLLDTSTPAEDTWSKRAWKNRYNHLNTLRNCDTYLNLSRYTRAVTDLNKVVENAGKRSGIQLSLANYQDPALSPLKSDDLLASSSRFAENIYYPFFSKRLTQLIEAHTPTFIGFSLNYLSQALCTFAMVGFVRQVFPQIQIVLGGGLVTTWLQNKGQLTQFEGLINHLVAGAGETQLLDIVEKTKLSRKDYQPDFTDLLEYNYTSPGFVLPYSSSTGCFWRKCSFCPETSEGNPFKPIPVEEVRSELATLADKTQPKLIHLLDNAISPAVLKSMTHQPPIAPWYGFVRFSEHLADPDFCQALKRSGCALLKIGLESGNQAVLDTMHKGIDLNLAHRALTALRNASIATYVYILFGTPGEAEEEARDTLHFVAAHHRSISFLNLAIFNLPIGSAEIDDLDIHDFYEADLSIYCDFEHPRGWNRKAIRHFLEGQFKREPRIKAILKRDPVHFTSNHAPFFSRQEVS